jgi:hypothetical protein
MSTPDPIDQMTTDLAPKPKIPPLPKCIFCWDKGEVEYLDTNGRIRSPCPECKTVQYREWVTKRYHTEAMDTYDVGIKPTDTTSPPENKE